MTISRNALDELFRKYKDKFLEVKPKKAKVSGRPTLVVSGSWSEYQFRDLRHRIGDVLGKVLIELGFRCPCGGRLQDVPGWNKRECEKCKRSFKY